MHYDAKIWNDGGVTIDQKGAFMADQMRSDLIVGMSKGIDDILLDWHRRPTLNEVVAAQVQSPARVISTTTNPGTSLAEVKNGLDSIMDLLRSSRSSRAN
jgi:hypothetical protein